MKEIIIDGNRYDVDNNTDVTLDYKSPFFSDISKLKPNRSYTIKLPFTAINRKNIENSYLIDVVSLFPYQKKSCEYWKNGLPIIQRGNAYLLACTSSIEVAATWGNGTAIVNIGDKKMTEITGISEEYIEWDDSIEIGITEKGNIHYSKIDFGMGLDKRYTRPVVSVKYLFDKIFENAGLDYSINTEAKNLLDKLWIPLLSNNPDENTFNHNYCSCDVIVDDLWANGAVGLNNFIKTTNTIEFLYHQVDGGSYAVLKATEDIKVTIRFNAYMNVFTDNENCYLIFSDGREIAIAPEGHSYSFNGTFEMDKGTFVHIEQHSKNNYGNGKIYIENIETKEVPFGTVFPIDINLPDIKQIDFLKSIMQMMCLFAHPDTDNPNLINLYSIDTLYNNKVNARDWTNKLLSRVPEEQKFTFGSYSKQNWMRYKEDDTVSINADDYLTVDNEYLETSQDLFTLSFSATDEKNGMAFISLYEQEEDKINENSGISPRILVDNYVTGEGWKASFLPYLSFSGESGLRNSYYTKYQEIIRQPRVISVKCALSDYDLYTLDLTIPVYFRQYGAYFAIINLKTGDKASTVQLLKL
ncbi:hypothetical protein [Coprobacter secundus]|uniref:hypothetical protein n=1 Tax=Coprobacter secundus TaxID=1501392 RepID=UPI0023F941E0|nr:hypothetical protein [Coprobacter secundus]